MQKIPLIILALVAIVGASLVWQSCSRPAQAASPRELASDTKEAIQEIKDKENTTFRTLDENVKRVNQLKARVQTTAVPADEVINELQSISNAFEGMVGRKEQIRTELLKKITNLQELRSKSQQEMASLQLKQADYQNQLRKLSDPNPEIVRVKQKAISQAARYVDTQLQIWQQFAETQRAIEGEVANVKQRIEEFMAIMESSVIVYGEALNLLKLQRDIQDALSVFSQDLPEIQRLAQEMEQSWDNVDALVQTLVSVAQSSSNQG
jgi:chromosome segregation ATPase